MIERVGRCEAQIWSVAAAGVIAAKRGPSVRSSTSAWMRKADRATGCARSPRPPVCPLQFHFFVDAPKAGAARPRRWPAQRGARRRLRHRGHSPTFFDFIEGVYEAPDPAELKGAVMQRQRPARPIFCSSRRRPGTQMDGLDVCALRARRSSIRLQRLRLGPRLAGMMGAGWLQLAENKVRPGWRRRRGDRRRARSAGRSSSSSAFRVLFRQHLAAKQPGLNFWPPSTTLGGGELGPRPAGDLRPGERRRQHPHHVLEMKPNEKPGGRSPGRAARRRDRPPRSRTPST